MRRWTSRIAKGLVALVLLVGLYGVGAVACLFAAIYVPEAKKAEAQSYATRIPEGTDSLSVHAIVGRPPDRRWRSVKSDPEITIMHEWRFGGGRLLVRLDRDRVVFANSHVAGETPVLNAAVTFFFWWMPYVFGEND
jgi:hypothetical protein